MVSKESLGSRARYMVFAIAFFGAVILPALTPVVASAAQLTQRSIALSSSSASAKDVTYKINFSSTGAAGAFVVDFCQNSPVVGQACASPAGFDATDVSTQTSGFAVNAIDSNTVRVVADIEANDTIEVDLKGIDNPTSSGSLYARIVTYDLAANASEYTSGSLGEGVVDDGGAAIYINNTVGVSGAVLETITFCVSGEAISADCGGVVDPVVTLGETVGDTKALIATALSQGSIYTQISTNAASGAVVSLKSNALGCGGLMRAGAPTACDISPALKTGVTAGEARFGLKTTDPVDSEGVTAVGTLQPVVASGYNKNSFVLNWILGDATGVTSVFGDPFLDTAGAPVNNKNMQIIFGASVSNNTPAGSYSADLSLIATGKF